MILRVSLPSGTMVPALILGVAAGAVLATAALAGTDATFTPVVTRISGWATGSLGKLAAVAGLASALVGMVLKFDWRLIASALGIGLTAASGPGVVTALASATF